MSKPETIQDLPAFINLRPLKGPVLMSRSLKKRNGFPQLNFVLPSKHVKTPNSLSIAVDMP